MLACQTLLISDTPDFQAVQASVAGSLASCMEHICLGRSCNLARTLRRSYAHFCACGRMLDDRLEQLGAKRFAGRADVNREDWKAVDTWIEAAVAGLDSLALKAHKDTTGATFL